MKFTKYLILFLVINFAGLYIGSLLMDNGPQTAWYLGLNKAPWTPPGWVFGVAWTIIMLCFSIYLAKLFTIIQSSKIALAFTLQVFFNIIWNYVFFDKHFVSLGLMVISALTVIIFTFFFANYKRLKKTSFLLLPYQVWLLIATSLNAYILIYN